MKTGLKFILALTTAIVPQAFDTESGWKKDAEGKLVTDADGNPVYIQKNGNESAVKIDTITRLNGEAATNRQRAEAAEAALAKFDNINPEVAKDAINKLKDVDLSKMITTDRLEELKADFAKTHKAEIEAKDAEIAKRDSQLNNFVLDGAFTSSKFIKDNVAVPPDMFRAAFGNNFKVINGVAVAVDKEGKPFASKKNFGETASFDEALEHIVDNYPHKDSILKAKEHRGSGNEGEGGEARPGTMRVAEFDKLSPARQDALMQEGKVKIVN